MPENTTTCDSFKSRDADGQIEPPGIDYDDREEDSMKCPNCGAQIGRLEGDLITCEYCASTFHARELDPSWKQPDQDSGVREVHHYHHQEPIDKLSAGLGCLIFLFFPLGWIIYFLYRDSSPRKARTAMIIAAVMTVFFVIGIVSGGGRG
jgi:hypothetical protein